MPAFNGYPQAQFARLPVQDVTTPVWTWTNVERRAKDLEAINLLVSQGFQLIEPGQSSFAYLLGQGYDVVLLETPETEYAELWARSDDIQQVEKFPVMLAFPLPE